MNITCKFRDGDISHLGVAYLTHAIHTVPDADTLCVFELLTCVVWGCPECYVMQERGHWQQS